MRGSTSMMLEVLERHEAEKSQSSASLVRNREPAHKKALVTGGTGFIGSHLCEALLEKGWDVVCLDDLSTGKRENIRHLEPADGFEFAEGSVIDPVTVSSALIDCSVVFHLAAVPGVQNSIVHPVRTNTVNIEGTLRILQAARKELERNGEQIKIVLASSSSVYGGSLDMAETASPYPRSPYAVSKLAAEEYCQVYTELFGVPTVCLRYFNVFGPRQNPDGEYAAVIPRFIQAIRKGELPIVYGDGWQTRDFTFVEDAVGATVLAGEKDVTGVFNVGTGRDRCVLDMLGTLRRIMGVMGTAPSPDHQRPRDGDVRLSLADLTKSHAVLGYKPMISFEEGLRRTVEYFEDR